MAGWIGYENASIVGALIGMLYDKGVESWVWIYIERGGARVSDLASSGDLKSGRKGQSRQWKTMECSQDEFSEVWVSELGLAVWYTMMMSESGGCGRGWEDGEI